MKLVVQEPLMVGWIPYCFKFQPRQFSSCFMVKAAFKMQPGGRAAAVEESVLLSGDVHVDDDPSKPLVYSTDFVPVKPRADVVIQATAHSPGGQPVQSLRVGARVGTLAKELTVYGKRIWKAGLLGYSGGMAPEPFVSVPLSYALSIGGAKSKLNPLGIGLDSNEMPRVEDVKSPIQKPRELLPAGFGPIPASWQPRCDLVGTYKGNWKTERWPWHPEDFDFGHFNAAPRDQQVEGYLRGDEEVQFDNLHPEQALYKCRLPGLRMRLFANTKTAKGMELREAPLKLDTLWIDLNEEKMILVWRGNLEVSNPKMREVEHLLAWSEPMAEPAKPKAHYEALLVSQLAAPAVEIDAPIVDESAAVDAAFEEDFAAMDQEFADAEKSMGALEIEMADQIEAEKAMLVERGMSASLMDAPPAEPSLAELKELIDASEDLTPEQKLDLHGQIAEMESMNKEFADMDAEFDQAFPPEPTRDEVLLSLSQGASLAGAELSGIDLSGQNLAGKDFNGANLSKANLAGANLSNARLDKADLIKANLAGADLSGAILTGADFNRANLAGAKLLGATLIGASLAGQDLGGFDLSGCNFDKADLAGANLAGANLTGARMVSADLSECNLEGANLTGANIARALLDTVNAKGAILEDADLSHTCATEAADFTGANFRKIKAPSAVFESALLDQADFSRSTLNGAQFGDASLLEAKFDRADLSGAMFDDALQNKCTLTRTNLLRAGFTRADLTDADLEGANAYEAGFWETNTKDTKLKGTNVRSTLLG
jgi:uncharacterized protein YjbI with pentapeptide repeats